MSYQTLVIFDATLPIRRQVVVLESVLRLIRNSTAVFVAVNKVRKRRMLIGGVRIEATLNQSPGGLVIQAKRNNFLQQFFVANTDAFGRLGKILAK